jgi:hypothetical protein
MKVRPGKKSRGRLIVLGAVIALLSGLHQSLGAGADERVIERPGFSLITRDGSGNVGQYSSIAIGADGLALISYYDATNGDLRVAHCADVACRSATHIVVQSQDDVGQFTSITIGPDGLPLISYYDATNGDLKVAHCSNSLCVPYHRR